MLLPLLAACAASPPAADRLPAEPMPGVRATVVTLYRDTVTVAMSDGSLCTGVRAARSGPWSTRLAGCPHLWPVEVRRPALRPRVPLGPVERAPWVTVTPPGGGALGFGPRRAGT